ncbi:MAG: LptF/LptG family permease [Planctomycetota bacterium]|nr:LptF/LptG family permease [Planctomycetota bacterium]
MDMDEQLIPSDLSAPDGELRLSGIPWTLWRHVAWELLRMFAVTTSVIVTVIAFGAAAKPLADNSIGANTIFKYVTLAMVPMLQFAMPFAAGFASTLVMHRFATDNEVTAMSACGMGYRKIFAPVAILGGTLCVVMLVLVAFVVPHFWTRMKELATADATQVLIAAVGRGEAVVADKMMIYADAAREVEPPAGLGIKRRLLLTGVAAIELDQAGGSSIATEFTAEDAAVDIHETPRGMVAKISLMNATVVRPSEGAIVTLPLAEPEASSLYSGFERGPKFLAVQEIFELRGNVDRSETVGTAKRPLTAALGELELWRCVEPAVARGTIEFTEPGTERMFRISQVVVKNGELHPAPGHDDFLLLETAKGKSIRSAHASTGTLRALSEAGFEPRFALIIPGSTQAQDIVTGLPGRWAPRIDDLLPVGCVPKDWSSAPSIEVLRAASEFPTVDEIAPLAAMRAQLPRQVARLKLMRDDVVWECDSHVANRLAQSASIVLVLLLGAALAVAMKRAMPLTVYLLAFIPAISNIFLVSGGQLLMSDGSLWVGSFVMWGGNLLLLSILFLTWRRIARN